jgi:hypothetical protein
MDMKDGRPGYIALLWLGGHFSAGGMAQIIRFKLFGTNGLCSLQPLPTELRDYATVGIFEKFNLKSSNSKSLG